MQDKRHATPLLCKYSAVTGDSLMEKVSVKSDIPFSRQKFNKENIAY